MDDSRSRFERRCAAVRRSHARMAQGFRTRMRKDGVIEQVPKGPGAARPVLRLVAWMAVALFCLKTAALVHLGPARYEAIRTPFLDGTAVETVIARAMGIDPVSRLVSDWIGRMAG